MYNSYMLTNLNHHAYLLTNTSAEDLIGELEEKFNINKKGNPDFFHEKFETLGIEDSRRIKEIHSSKGFSEQGKRIFIIETQAMTTEAQNSLLKIFEEPHANTYFFIITRAASSLLPTLRSRLFIIESKKDKINEEQAKTVRNFLKLSIKDRITFVDNLAKKISDEELSKSSAIEFLNELEIILHEDVEKNKEKIKILLKVRDYMNDRSPSIKQLLEYIAMSV